MNMRNQLLLIGVLVVACSTDVDCRHKSLECASGFTCEEQAGVWVCQKEEAAADGLAVQESTEAPEGERIEPRPTKSAEPAPCPQHQQCPPNALGCVCDPGGRLLSRSIDKDGDGNPDEKAVFQYDGRGHLAHVMVDEGLDGTADKRHSYRYDDRGNPVEWEVVGLPSGTSPDDKSLLSYRYDEGGNLIAEELDLGIDDKIDKSCVYDPPCPSPIPNPDCQRICQ